MVEQIMFNSLDVHEDATAVMIYILWDRWSLAQVQRGQLHIFQHLLLQNQPSIQLQIQVCNLYPSTRSHTSTIIFQPSRPHNQHLIPQHSHMLQVLCFPVCLQPYNRLRIAIILELSQIVSAIMIT